MLSTGRLLPMRLDEISQTATWTHCVAYCQLERERIDFTKQQIKAIGVNYQYHEQQRFLNRSPTQSSKLLYGSNPQQFIFPGYYTKKLHVEYSKRNQSLRKSRKKKLEEKFAKMFRDSKKSRVEVFSDLKVAQSLRYQQVMERQSVYVSQVNRTDEENGAEVEVVVHPGVFWKEGQGLDQVREDVRGMGTLPFWSVVDWMGNSYRFFRSFLPFHL
ncbi:uncharacterized protein MELLADRAFT_111221 [Melampsora larici-populina 98AG31]|uniref:Uncharacterized protein n=1 Tax=Melampsora larici-populina (strain 98AG31 / pathotype 3-4-7) TaxID=747676 RepID=F4S2F4_MELLP|nr:uncharacterized protein MELLADRAFT_111221 [Melampsora larici-populina 98AG31]EGG01214.1 hypothetical protein MELLADRAFT_111221 [Melampsora larici-populina 98AG31]